MMIRVRSSLKGEVATGTLEAFRRAGGMAYGELAEAEAARDALVAEGVRPWELPAGTAARLLCAWNAFVLQSVGEHLLDADRSADPGTAGFVPPVTHTQVRACFDEVEGWVSQARQAAHDEHHTLGAERALPANLPQWAEADPCPLPHLRGMLAATRAVRGHAEVALAVFERAVHGAGPADVEAAEWARRLRQVAADASTAADYAEGLLERDPDASLHEAIEERLQRALEGYFDLGQLVAMPGLVDGYTIGAVPDALPDGVKDFCPWGAIYTVRRPVTIRGRRLWPGVQFTFEVSGARMESEGRFVRKVVTGTFSPSGDKES